MVKNNCNFIKRDGKQCRVLVKDAEFCRHHKRGKIKSSCWLFTINTNRQNHKIPLSERHTFKMMCKFLFGKNRAILNFVDDKDHGQDLTPILKDVETDYNIEIGPQTDQLHCHAILKLAHTGYVTFRANILRAFMKKIFGYNLYLESSVSKDAVMLMKQYVLKEK